MEMEKVLHSLMNNGTQVWAQLNKIKNDRKDNGKAVWSSLKRRNPKHRP